MLIFCVGIVFSETVNKAFLTGSICWVVVGILLGIAARALLSASSSFALLVDSLPNACPMANPIYCVERRTMSAFVRF